MFLVLIGSWHKIYPVLVPSAYKVVLNVEVDLPYWITRLVGSQLI